MMNNSNEACRYVVISTLVESYIFFSKTYSQTFSILIFPFSITHSFPDSEWIATLTLLDTRDTAALHPR